MSSSVNNLQLNALIIPCYKVSKHILDVLSNILGKFISVGFFALIVVFQQEIRKFLLLIGSTNFASRRNVIRYFNFLNQDQEAPKADLTAILNACEKMAKEKTGASIVLEKENSYKNEN